MVSIRDRVRPLKQRLGYCTRYVMTPCSDWVQNSRLLTDEPRFLILRHRAHLTRYYDGFVRWLGSEMPDVRARFELQSLPCLVRDWSRFRLLVPWLPDPMLHEKPRIRARVKRIELHCQQHGIAVINPVDQVLKTAKSTGAEIIRSVGIRAPRATQITDLRNFHRNLGGLEFPLLIREDRAHAGRLPIYLARTMRELEQVPVQKFANPIAVEFIDVRDPRDGLSRRYRYFAAGELGMAMNIHCSEHWEVRGRNAVHNAQREREEVEFIRQPDPNHERLQEARRALGLDFVAFDYSYGQDGELIVWEANVMPGLGYSKTNQNRPYLQAIAERAFDMILDLYYRRSGLDVPQQVTQRLAMSADYWFDRPTSQAA
jgi:hypothetical protein